jgi:CheY-like chemotaxis protein
MHGTQPSAAELAAPGAAERRGLRVIVVDDCVDRAHCLALLLRYFGHVVHVTHDGASTLAQLPAFDPDLVLMDIGLPDMPGQNVVRRIRQDPAWRDLPVVALTGWTGNAMEESCLTAGFNLFLVKPADIDFLSNLPEVIAHCNAGLSVPVPGQPG